jgi:tRNA (mo5U34)-methyltransferase
MAKRSLGFRGFRLEVEVPERLGAAVRRVTGRKPASRKPHQLLEFPESVPQLHLTNTTEAVERYVDNLRASLRWLPDGWAGPQRAVGEDLATSVSRLYWYHTIELPGGVTTPGYYDHRPLVPHYGLPDDLTGKRVLDVGTWDGFWAFELERRGGDVTALDLDRLSQVDLPPAARQAVIDAGLDQPLGAGFALAAEALSSKVKRTVGSVYQLDPADLGTFDFVHFSDVSLHLERPLQAYRKIRSVTAGTAMIVDTFDPALDADPERRLTEYRSGWTDVTWWTPSLNTLAQMILDAGFSDVRVHRVYRLNPRVEPGPGAWRAIMIARV